MIVRLSLPHDDTVHEYAFRRSEALIGRSRRTDLCVPLSGVSLRYARLRRADERVWLEPLRPGTTLVVERDKVGRIKSSSAIGLLPGDRILLGKGTERATIELVASAAEQDTAPRPQRLFRLDDPAPQPIAALSAALNRFAMLAAGAASLDALREGIDHMASALTGSADAPAGLVLFGAPAQTPLVAVSESLAPWIAYEGSLTGHAKRRREILRRLASGEVLLVQTGPEPLVLVPLPGPTGAPEPSPPDGQVRGCWVFRPSGAQLAETLPTVAADVSHLLVCALERLAQSRQLTAVREENLYFRARERRHYLFKDLVTDSPRMKAVYEDTRRIVDESTAVLILGEKGTGKEMIARALHHLSHRAHRLMISQNCATLDEAGLGSELFGRSSLADDFDDGGPAKGLLELCRGGTLFLEAVDHLPPRLQTRLIRAIIEREVRPEGEAIGRPVDVRILVSSERDLFPLVEAGQFRKDLYLDLAEKTIRLPPLRQRLEDIQPLADVFVAQIAPRYHKRARRVSEAVGDALRTFPWPGNVRELQGLMEAAVIRVDPESEEVTELPWSI